ncbi:12382_t:CDS:2 [Entrophospora sp. SA101]|nr:11182_t:CDS:2 [Entrophospora sp. SA101]CAJ0750595.1 2081_t:CDS:2 [Entrophospora sp. SA101]CAJ0750598.1 2084_t:CDS:2 [Entrophospora sp. SA101]CAJ0759938.1 12382_t:CDS:2 [Entrophospora sp. SA101]CAJ0832971.1 11995_t:CDS:2 [Entrophospora sp. SA101]
MFQKIINKAFSFQVNFKGKALQIKDFPFDKTILELKEHLEELTNIPKEYQKLIFKVLLKDAFTLREGNIKNGTKVMLMGSSQQEIQNLKESESKSSSIKHESKYAINPYKNLKKFQGLNSQKYTFHQIRVIEKIPKSEKAHEILERLRDDRGIKAIMQKYKFSVGTLQEMDFSRMFLSSNNTKLLGYNVNKGESISLRLRTDDLQGFRHYADIKKVLLHELTHNVWDGHDENFHQLNRQLNKDAVSLDWTLSDGKKLSNEEFYNPSEQEGIDTRSWQGGAYVLGGDTERAKILSKRELLAEATLMRLTKEEKELDESCGFGSNPSSESTFENH